MKIVVRVTKKEADVLKDYLKRVEAVMYKKFVSEVATELAKDNEWKWGKVRYNPITRNLTITIEEEFITDYITLMGDSFLAGIMAFKSYKNVLENAKKFSDKWSA
jgi:ribonucleotide reductase beta subunit family protein with ferritin-like domain